MPELTLTRVQARRFLLVHQGLWPPRIGRGKSAVLSFIRRVGCIQFDPLNIVGHNPELVLQARMADFRPAMLRELLYEDRKLLDGWDKMMAIHPVEDWPYFGRQREAARRRVDRRTPAVAGILPEVRRAISERGPLSSLDLAYDETVDWPWAPTRLARAALEGMYFWGELVIDHKVHTRKVYDFAVHHLPAELLSAPDPNRTEEEYHDWHVLRRIGGVGLLPARSGDAWLGIPGLKGPERQAALRRLLDRGEVLETRVEGLNCAFFLRSEDRPCLERAVGAVGASAEAAVLAPLDNLLWDRRLVKDLFDFDYRWEVYKRPADRRFGYYVLPVLQGDGFVARFEPGWDKRNRLLTIKKWWWEPGAQPERTGLRECFGRFLEYLGAEALRIDRETCARNELAWLSP